MTSKLKYDFLRQKFLILKQKDLEIEIKLALLESVKTKSLVPETEDISAIQETEMPQTQFL